MTIDLRVTFRDFTPPILAEERIQKRIRKLERLYPRIVSCHVIASESHRTHKKGRLYSVHIDAVIPGSELAAARDRHNRHSHENFYVALRDSFDALERQLKSHSERRSPPKSVGDIQLRGRVTKVFPDYGFVETEDGAEYYFHADDVKHNTFSKLSDGDEIRFSVSEKISEHGEHAHHVRLIKPGH